MEADAVDGGDIVSPCAPAPLDGQVQSSAEHAKKAHAADGGDAAVLAVGDGDEKYSPQQDSASPHRHTPAGTDAVDRGDIAPPSEPAPQDCVAVADDSAAGHAGEEDAVGGSAEKSLAATTSIVKTLTGNTLTAEQDEVAQSRQRHLVADAASVAGGPMPGEASGGGGTGVSSATARQSSASDIGLGDAVLAAAQELAQSCQIPGVSEAVGAVFIMANLVTDSRENDVAIDARLRQCRSIVLTLKRADKVIVKVS